MTQATDLDPKQQQRLDLAIMTINGMTDDERCTMLEHVVRASIQYAESRRDETLRELARSVLGTIRVHASESFHKAMAGHSRPDLTRPGVNVAELLAGLHH